MSNTITTVKSSTSPATARRIAATAKRLGETFAEKGRVHVKRAEYVLALRNLGLSYAGMEKHVTVTLGYRPSGATGSTFGRYGQIIDALARPDVDAVIGTSDAREAIVAGLYRLSGPTPKSGTLSGTSPAERVSRAADMMAKAKASAQAVEAVDTLVTAFNAGEVADATTAPKREVSGEAADGGKAPKADATREAGKTHDDTVRDLASVGTLSLAQALAKRVTAKGFTPDAALLSALTRIASAVEAAMTDAPVASK